MEVVRSIYSILLIYLNFFYKTNIENLDFQAQRTP